MDRRRWTLAVALFLAGCQGTSSGVPAPTSTPIAPAEHLYVANDKSSGGIAQYALPISTGESPGFTLPAVNTVALVFDGNGNLAAGDNAGRLTFFSAPLSAASTPGAAFLNGTAANNGQLAFTSAGDLYAAGVNPAVNIFRHPFRNALAPSSALTHGTFSSVIGAGFDGSANLYVSNAGPAGSNLAVFAPPYNGAPTLTPTIATAVYRKLAVSGNRLFVASVAGASGAVDVYALPLNPSSAPVFSITSGVATPEALAVDAGGKLYVGNLSNSTVTVYAPPFSASSAPVATLSVFGGNGAVFGIALGP
jgi:hypothetical protein